MNGMNLLEQYHEEHQLFLNVLYPSTRADHDFQDNPKRIHRRYLLDDCFDITFNTRGSPHPREVAVGLVPNE